VRVHAYCFVYVERHCTSNGLGSGSKLRSAANARIAHVTGRNSKASSEIPVMMRELRLPLICLVSRFNRCIYRLNLAPLLFGEFFTLVACHASGLCRMWTRKTRYTLQRWHHLVQSTFPTSQWREPGGAASSMKFKTPSTSKEAYPSGCRYSGRSSCRNRYRYGTTDGRASSKACRALRGHNQRCGRTREALSGRSGAYVFQGPTLQPFNPCSQSSPQDRRHSWSAPQSQCPP